LAFCDRVSLFSPGWPAIDVGSLYFGQLYTNNYNDNSIQKRAVFSF
jgi:hypothetical protein